ncbi:MAG: class I SAM-dependent methyltransferase [Anaerolineae bacterium]|nr:class I SAM-dependent methyltransferase [Anaerolineae bacterium]
MTSKQWQLAQDAAERYQEILVPAILGPFAQALVDWADLRHDPLVVDVGCGTGAAARFAADKIGTAGRVIGTDINPGMLRVAQALPNGHGAPLEWRQESAYALSFGDETADVVLCAQTLQFLNDRLKALQAMRRILKPGAALYVSLWCDIEQNPYFDTLVQAVARNIGADTAAGLGAAFSFSDLDAIQDMVRAAGFADLKTTIAEIALALPPIPEFVPRHIQATPLGPGYNAASPAARQATLDFLTEQLSAYQTDTGIGVPFRSHLIQAVK